MKYKAQADFVISIIVIVLILALVVLLLRFMPSMKVGSIGNESYNADKFIDAMRLNGANIFLEGPLWVSILSVRGKVYNVDSENLIVFEYTSESGALKDVSQIKGLGGIINGQQYAWQGSPHFYRIDNVIVLYVGSNQKILSYLNLVMGQQFIGTSDQVTSKCSINNPCSNGRDTCVSFLTSARCYSEDLCLLCDKSHQCTKINSYPLHIICTKI
jgi:hypothetical protein